MRGLVPPEHDQVEFSVGRKIPSKLGLEEQVRVILGNVGGMTVVMPIGGGAGVITSLVRAEWRFFHDGGHFYIVNGLPPDTLVWTVDS
jgi:molybdopterin biosynthesis enzyme